jgi:hypothetical protein
VKPKRVSLRPANAVPRPVTRVSPVIVKQPTRVSAVEAVVPLLDDSMVYQNDAPSGRLVEGVRNELPGLLGTAVIDLETGMSLASFSGTGAFDPETAGAYHTEAIKKQLRAMEAFALNDSPLEDVIVTVDTQMHLMRLNRSQTKFLYVAISPRDTNLAIARKVLHRYAAEMT